MLSSIIVNALDMFNIIYLWAILSKNDSNKFKLLLSTIITCILTTIIEKIGLNFILVHIMIILIIKAVYTTELKEIVLGFILVLLIEMSLQLILFLFLNKLIYNNTVITISTELIILASIIIFSKTSVSKKIVFKIIDKNILGHFILTCSIYAIVFKIIWNYDQKIIMNNLLITSVIFSILVISQVFTYGYIRKTIMEKEKLKISNEYNAVIEEIVQEIKQRQHDFINYKNTIKGIVNVVDEKELKEAISNYIKDEDIYDNKINDLIYIDNVVIRSIIYRNICRFKKYDIKFEYEIENNTLDNILSYHEISNLLNNLLNNAFEEVIKKECTNKIIGIKVFCENGITHLIIKNQVANPSGINLNEMFERGYSTKGIGTRGYGLHNVQAIVDSHKGNIKINVECGEIIFDIYFNNSSG